MSSKPAPLPVTHDISRQRFEAQADGVVAFLSYRHEAARVLLEHTYVPDELRGRGVAGALVRAALEEARQQGWRIVPRCSFVADFIQRNPEFADLVAAPA
jgi:predicted GNAT family acetyltransferase